jgi:hypothetical protein
MEAFFLRALSPRQKQTLSICPFYILLYSPRIHSHLPFTKDFVKMRKAISTAALAAAALFLAAALSREASAMFSGGYVLAGAYAGTSTSLLDSTGTAVFTWHQDSLTEAEGNLNGYSSYLLPNGNLLRSALVPKGLTATGMSPRQGIIHEIDRSGKVVWKYQLANDTFMLHHDMKPMPNGHILAVSFVVQTKAQMIATGVDTNLLKGMTGSGKYILSEKIIEIDPRAAGGPKIVWEWRMYEHVVKGDSAGAHPELISGKITGSLFYTYQWVHLNSLDYDTTHDLILFSSRVFSELFVIDHGTTTEQASGHTGGKRGKGGDILYRWGNPSHYKASASGVKTLNVLHGCNWIPASYPGGGDIIFFHNNGSIGMAKGEAGMMPSSSQSEVIEIKTPMDANCNFPLTAGQAFTPAQPTWIFAPADSFYSPSMSCAYRLPSGNTLALVSYPSTAGGMNLTNNSILVEVDNNKKVQAKIPLTIKSALDTASGTSFNPAKIMFYEKDYIGAKVLLGKVGIRDNDKAVSGRSPLSRLRMRQAPGRIDFSDVAGCDIGLFDLQGKKVLSVASKSSRFVLGTGLVPAGLYCVKVTSAARTTGIRMVEIRR